MIAELLQISYYCITMTILDKIVEQKRHELEEHKRREPLPQLKRRAAQALPPLDFAKALKGDKIRLIAEVKKASPSHGLLAPNFDPAALAKTYAKNGAAVISVLTEVPNFQGSLEHLATVRSALNGSPIPILRKDFLFDTYQLYEARAYGADALLLIVAILDDSLLQALIGKTRELGMEALVEVHNPKEVEQALNAGAAVIGINNRDLTNFHTDIATTQALRPLIPGDRMVVSESGIHTKADVEKLKGWGVDAILVGEALVTAPDIAAKVRELS